jgi:hypothetical protein
MEASLKVVAIILYFILVIILMLDLLEFIFVVYIQHLAQVDLRVATYFLSLYNLVLDMLFMMVSFM